MLALAYSFSLFVFWTIVGRALMAVVAPRFGALRAWLLSPALGLAVTLFGLTVFNQAGLPIGAFARPLTAVLLVAGVAVLVWKRPVLPWRAAWPFFAAAVFSLLWTGWPAFETGFNWISYGNDDMANYCLAAERFGDHGFYEVPTMAELAGRDYSAYYFFMHVADMMRYGAEHVVSWASRLGGIKATSAFMPAIIALALTQLFSAAGLALQHGRHRRRALATAWLLAVSPLFMLGTLYQLIAQVGGIALMLATLALMTHTCLGANRRTIIRYSVLCGFAGMALCLFYPETTPFAVVTYLGYYGLALFRRRVSPGFVIALTGYSLLGVILLLRHNLISYISTLVMQLASAMHGANLLLSLFPYFLLPTGFSNFFGWMPIARDFAEPVVSLSIGAGMILLVVLVIRALREAWQLRVISLLLLVQLAVAFKLYLSASDFNLYKLAMWTQPALAAALAGLMLRFRSGRMLVVLFAVTTIPSALYYTQASEGSRSGGLTELRFASRLGMEIPPPSDADAQITASIENVVAAKFASEALRGREVSFASRDYFYPNTRIDFEHPPLPVRFQPHFHDMAQSLPLKIERNDKWEKTSTLWKTEFSQPVLTHATDYYLSLARQLSLFNKFGQNPTTPIDRIFVMQPADAVHNQLTFVHSGRGNHYYLGNRGFISFFQQEEDLFSPGHDFSALGRFMLLRVEHPTGKIYLRIAATRTLVAGGTQWKPEALVHAATERPIGLVGSGAFNLFVGPLVPQVFEGASYVAIDFMDTPRPVPDYRTGLKTLYNRDVPLDYRRMIGWARDISAISEAEYHHLDRPRRVRRFPADLADAQTLEFVGAYEDGWLSSDCRFRLAAARPGEAIRLRGVVPALAGTPLGSGNMEITVNGQPACTLSASSGDFDWLIPVPEDAGAEATELSIHFTVSAPLPGRDQRPSAARLFELALVPAASGHAGWDYTEPGTPRLAAPGVDQDGWLARDSAVEVPAHAEPATLVLHLDTPGWEGLPVLHVAAGADNQPAPLQTLTPGANVLRVALPPSASPVLVHLTFDHDFPLSPNDRRQRSSRLLKVELAPASRP